MTVRERKVPECVTTTFPLGAGEGSVLMMVSHVHVVLVVYHVGEDEEWQSECGRIGNVSGQQQRRGEIWDRVADL